MSLRAAISMLTCSLLVLSCGKTTDSTPSTDNDCAAPTMACSGACVNIATHPAHCGRCDAPCPVGDSCVDGACQSSGCPAAQSMCGGMCVPLMENPLNCGSCGEACANGETCVDGQCTCSPPKQDCGGACVDVRSSTDHCGACGAPCAEGEDCTEGACQSRCVAPLSFCTPDRCVDLTSNPEACGNCDAACAQGEVCVDGSCVCSGPTRAVCGGACIDTATAGEHCGGCGNACPAGTRCEAGACTACSSDFFFCPSVAGDALQICLEQASTAASVSLADAPSATGGPDLACQCQNCLAELQDCVGDSSCISTWQCAIRNTCTEPCWDTMGVCSIPTDTTGCFKFCAPSTGSTQTAARAEALLRCTIDSGCGI